MPKKKKLIFLAQSQSRLSASQVNLLIRSLYILCTFICGSALFFMFDPIYTEVFPYFPEPVHCLLPWQGYGEQLSSDSNVRRVYAEYCRRLNTFVLRVTSLTFRVSETGQVL